MRFSSIPRAIAGAFLLSSLSFGAWASDLKIVMESRLGNLDPILSASHQTRDHGYLIYDTLFGIDESGAIQPQMLKAYALSEDGKTYTFTLRDGLLFHNGEPVTATDVIASIKRWGARDRMGINIFSITDRLEAKGPKTFVLTLKEPSGVVIDALAKASGVPLFIMPAGVAATPVTEAITDYTGSGPFIFKADEYVPGVRAVYVKNEKYVPRSEPASGLAGGKVAKVDKIERIEMPDPLTAINALTEGEIDFLQTVPFDLASLVEGNQDIKTIRLDKMGYQYSYRFNQLTPPFNNKLVRQAALWAISQPEIMQTMFGSDENYSLCGAVFGCGTTYASQEGAEMVVKANPEKAKALLQEAGYNGEPVTILHVTDIAAMAAIAPVMAQQLQAAGFTVNMQAMDFMTMLSRRASQAPVSEGGWSIFTTSWHVSEIQDPVRSYMILAEGPKGYAGWADFPEMGKQIHAFLTEPDLDARKAIAANIQKVVYDEGIYAPLGISARLSAFRANVDGLISAPVNVFWNVSKAEK